MHLIEHEMPLADYNWDKILGQHLPQGHTVVRSVATFFPAEADSNRQGAPRLDVVLTLSDNMTVHYHPKAELIWMNEPQPTIAMRARMNLAHKLRK